MKIYRSLILAAFSLLLAASIQAQDKEEKQKGYDPENWFTGGSISLGYGGGTYSSSFIAGLHPHYGYTLAKWLDVAGVVNFEYQSQRDPSDNKYRSTTYGLGAFMRIFPVHFIFIQAEPEYNFIRQKYIPYNAGVTLKQTLHAPSFLVGGGYTTSRSDKNTFTYLSILLDVAKNINSPYLDGAGHILPIIRAGVNIGLNRTKRNKSK